MPLELFQKLWELYDSGTWRKKWVVVTEVIYAASATILSGLLIAMFLAALDQTIVSTAIYKIGESLHGLTAQAWVTTSCSAWVSRRSAWFRRGCSSI